MEKNGRETEGLTKNNMQTIKIAPNAILAEHCGHYKTFVNCSFLDMLDWAYRVQRTHRI